MKCPECNRQHKLKRGMRCACRYEFVLSPKIWPKIADGVFLAVVRKTSANGTYHFTRNQLLAQLRGRISAEPSLEKALLVLSGLFAVFSLLFMEMNLLTIISLVVFITIAMRRSSRKRNSAGAGLDKATIGRWLAKKGSIDGLILEPSLHEPPPDWEESDMYDYGVERVMIVQHDLQVDQLVLNELHAAERMLVVAESGYPSYLMPRLTSLLNENEELPVFVLHDPSPEGCGMVKRLRSDSRFGLADREIIDLGLTPQDVRKLPKLMKNHPGRDAADIPVDAVLYPTLALGLSSALADEIALGQLLNDRSANQKSAHDNHFG